MSDEYIIEAPEVGVQNDGEPVAVVEEPTTLAEAVEQVEEEPTEQEATEKKKTGSQRARERAQRLEAENEALRRLLTQNQPKEETPIPKNDEPKAEDFDSHEAWVKASIRYEAKKLLEEEKAQAESSKRQNSWNEKAAQARSKYEDFDEALQEAPAPSPSVAEALSESPLGAEVAYHLATHPELYRRINQLGPVAAARELGILEVSLAPKSEAPKQTTKAPKPVAPVTAPVAPKSVNDGLLVY